MQDKDTTQSTLFQVCSLLHGDKVSQSLREQEVDKYTKKLGAVRLYELICLAQAEQLSSLRDIGNLLNNGELSRLPGIESISASQISRRLRVFRQRPSEEFSSLPWQRQPPKWVPIEFDKGLGSSLKLQAGSWSLRGREPSKIKGCSLKK